jgi:hypothetical protein
MSEVKLIIWDWFKTLSPHHLYESLRQNNPAAYELIQQYFVEHQEELLAWHQGKLGYTSLHTKFAEITGIDPAEFDKSLNSITPKDMVDREVMAYVNDFAGKGIAQVIASDNYDIWDEFFLPQYASELTMFTGFHSPTDFRIMTLDQHAEFLKGIAASYQIELSKTILIDDYSELTSLFSKLGGRVINHTDRQDLLSQLKNLA